MLHTGRNWAAALAVAIAAIGLPPQASVAQVPTWLGTLDDVWENGPNWSTALPPGTGETATFSSTQGNVRLGSLAEIRGIDFAAGSPSMTVVVGGQLRLTGTGIVNNSQNAQTVVVDGSTAVLTLLNSSTLGSARIIASNQGTVSLAGTSSGGTAAIALSGGTLSLADHAGVGTTIGSLAGTGSVLLSSRQLSAGGDNTSTTFAGVISGTGSFTKSGSGTMSLTGSSTYTGLTTVETGKLLIYGRVAGDVEVNAGGTLGGTGTVGGSVFLAGGTIAPANSIGTMTILGTFSEPVIGSGYYVDVNGAGQSDLIAARSAALANVAVRVFPEGGVYRRTTTYTILTTSAGVSGTFSGVSSEHARLVPSLSYGPNSVTLTLLNLDATYDSPGFSANQNAVAGALNLANAGATGDFATVLNALSNLEPASLARTLDVISGQSYSAFGSLAVLTAQGFMANFQSQAGGGQAFGGTAAVSGRSTYTGLAEACDVACDTSSTPRWGAWGGGLGAFGTVAGNSNASGITYSLGGFAAGLDRKFGKTFTAGFATGFSTASLQAQTLPGNGTTNTLQLALYGAYAEGPVYLDVLAGYAHADNRQSRPIAIAGLPYRVAQGYTTANQFFGQLEGGYRIDVDQRFGGYVMPFARLQGSTSTQNGFTESGADSLNLTVAQQTTNSLRTVLGAQFGAAIDTGWHRKLNVMFKAGWSHEFADLTRPVTASFAGAPAPSFTTQGAIAPRDGVVLGFGLNTSVTEQTSLYLRYDGDLAGGNTNHALSAGFRFVW